MQPKLEEKRSVAQMAVDFDREARCARRTRAVWHAKLSTAALSIRIAALWMSLTALATRVAHREDRFGGRAHWRTHHERSRTHVGCSNTNLQIVQAPFGDASGNAKRRSEGRPVRSKKMPPVHF